MSIPVNHFSMYLFLSLWLITIANSADAKFVVHTKQGPVQGIVKYNKIVSFLGLGYAPVPPRFSPPQAFPDGPRWNGVKHANVSGNKCLQPHFGGSEDCLYLDIHVPVKAFETSLKLPALFFIHGGCFNFGSGSDHGPELLLERENAILITINYRLGVLGWLSLGKDSSITPNNGLRDMVAALKWTNENIAAFQGDPDKITLMGNSAGSSSVQYILMSPLAKGLFHQAILMSGAISMWSFQPHARLYAEKFAQRMGCDNSTNGIEIRKCLEKKSGSELVNAAHNFSPRWPTDNFLSRFAPSWEEGDTFFGSSPTNVTVIMGVVKDEGSSFLAGFVSSKPGAVEQLITNWTTLAPKAFGFDDYFSKRQAELVAEKLFQYYFPARPMTRDEQVDVVSRIYTDLWMHVPVFKAAKDLARSGLKVYPYIYTYEGLICYLRRFNAPCLNKTVAHNDDIQHLFTNPVTDKELEKVSTWQDKQFSKRYVKMLTDFAATGLLPSVWKSINANGTDIQFMEINSSFQMVDESKYGFQERLDFLTVFQEVLPK